MFERLGYKANILRTQAFDGSSLRGRFNSSFANRSIEKKTIFFDSDCEVNRTRDCRVKS